MNISYKEYGNTQLVVHLAGEFDAEGASQTRPELERIATDTHTDSVVVDLNGVTFLDSSGIGAIVFLFKRLKANNRQLRLSGAHGQPAELLQLLRIHKAIPVELAGTREGGSCAA
jgi:stage II sporulation protein AA (anti-sigma F factor antagonist)